MSGAAGIRAGRAYVEIGADSAALRAAMSAAESALKGFGAAIAGVGRDLLDVGLTFLKPFTASLGVFMDFEYAMAKVASRTNTAGEAFQELTDEARRIGRETVFMAVDAAEAMNQFSASGFSARDILLMTSDATNLAAASQTDLATAARVASVAMRDVGLESDQFNMVADVIAKASITGGVNLEELGDALKYVGPLSTAVGWQFTELVAAVQLLGKSGIRGQMAGTSLRGILATLADPSAKAQEEMARLGVQFIDAKGNVRSLTAVLKDFEKAFAGATTGDRIQALARIFPNRALAAAAALLNKGTGALSKQKGVLDAADEENTAEKVAKRQLQSMKGAWLLFKSSVEDVAIALGTQLSPALQALGPVAVGVLSSVSAWIAANGAWVLGLAAAAAGMVTLGAAVLAGALAVKVFWLAMTPVTAALNVLGMGVHFAFGVVQLFLGILAPLAGALFTLGGALSVAAAGLVFFFDVGRAKAVFALAGAILQMALSTTYAQGVMLGFGVAWQAVAAQLGRMAISIKLVVASLYEMVRLGTFWPWFSNGVIAASDAFDRMAGRVKVAVLAAVDGFDRMAARAWVMTGSLADGLGRAARAAWAYATAMGAAAWQSTVRLTAALWANVTAMASWIRQTIRATFAGGLWSGVLKVMRGTAVLLGQGIVAASVAMARFTWATMQAVYAAGLWTIFKTTVASMWGFLGVLSLGVHTLSVFGAAWGALGGLAMLPVRLGVGILTALGPMGLLTAAAAALGVTLLRGTDWGQVGTVIGQSLERLLPTVKATWGEVSALLSDGQIVAAASIGVAGLGVVWAELKVIWVGILAEMEIAFGNAGSLWATLAEVAVTAIGAAFEGLKFVWSAILAVLSADLDSFGKKAAPSLWNKFQKAWEWAGAKQAALKEKAEIQRAEAAGEISPEAAQRRMVKLREQFGKQEADIFAADAKEEARIQKEAAEKAEQIRADAAEKADKARDVADEKARELKEKVRKSRQKREREDARKAWEKEVDATAEGAFRGNVEAFGEAWDFVTDKMGGVPDAFAAGEAREFLGLMDEVTAATGDSAEGLFERWNQGGWQAVLDSVDDEAMKDKLAAVEEYFWAFGDAVFDVAEGAAAQQKKLDFLGALTPEELMMVQEALDVDGAAKGIKNAMDKWEITGGFGGLGAGRLAASSPLKSLEKTSDLQLNELRGINKKLDKRVVFK